MFVPCDEDGNVLEHPNITRGNGGADIYNALMNQYQESEKRVLFDGFSLYYSVLDESNMLKYNKNSKEKVFNADALFRIYETIEDLVQYDLTLTENAIKKFKI
jgi:hypothetical protein